MYACLILPAARAPADVWDGEKEKQVAERLLAEIDNADVIWLKPLFSDEFPAIFTSAGPYAHDTAIILLHGMGGHPDWPVVISPLRRYLKLHHWTTLSIQLPVLEAGRSPSDYGKTLQVSGLRIQRAIEYLATRHYGKIVLLGYGFGAATAVATMAREEESSVDGLIGVSMLARKFLDPGIDLTELLGKTRVPVLDVFAENDKPAVINNADDRRLAARKNGHSGFMQVIVEDTDHYYSGHEQALLEKILHWLETEINNDDTG